MTAPRVKAPPEGVGPYDAAMPETPASEPWGPEETPPTEVPGTPPPPPADPPHVAAAKRLENEAAVSVVASHYQTRTMELAGENAELRAQVVALREALEMARAAAQERASEDPTDDGQVEDG